MCRLSGGWRCISAVRACCVQAWTAGAGVFLANLALFISQLMPGTNSIPEVLPDGTESKAGRAAAWARARLCDVQQECSAMAPDIQPDTILVRHPRTFPLTHCSGAGQGML
jgi:hypothetical protein